MISPSKTIKRDIIRTKGGKNSCILSDSIDIKALRDFQMLEVSLQGKNHSFKQTPPGFSKTILKKKRDGELFEHIKSNEESNS